MEQKIGEIACQMFAFNDLLDSVNVNEDRQIVEYCEKVVSYVNKIGLVCPRYDAYKAEWERFHITQDVHEKKPSRIVHVSHYLFSVGAYDWRLRQLLR